MRLALAQIEVKYGDKKSNLEKVLGSIEYAATRGSDIIVFPECCDIGWANLKAKKLAETLSGDFLSRIREKADERDIHVLVGLTEKEKKKVYNTAALIGTDGKVLSTYRKINELDFAKRIYAAGREISCFELCGSKAGISICADNFIPDIVDKYHESSAGLILSPCAWAAEKGKEDEDIDRVRGRLRERTDKKDMTIVCVNSVGMVGNGKWKGYGLIGNSTIMGPNGRADLEMGRGESVHIIDL